MIVSAGKNETFPFATPLGVGLIETAMNFTQLCLFNKPDYVVFIGSAGSYGKYKIFDILCITHKGRKILILSPSNIIWLISYKNRESWIEFNTLIVFDCS